MKQQHRLAGAIGIVIALAVLAGVLTAAVFADREVPQQEQAVQTETVQLAERDAGAADVQQDYDGALTCFWLILSGLAAASLCLSISQNKSHS